MATENRQSFIFLFADVLGCYHRVLIHRSVALHVAICFQFLFWTPCFMLPGMSLQRILGIYIKVEITESKKQNNKYLQSRQDLLTKVS
jgi:hypothetical protein